MTYKQTGCTNVKLSKDSYDLKLSKDSYDLGRLDSLQDINPKTKWPRFSWGTVSEIAPLIIVPLHSLQSCRPYLIIFFDCYMYFARGKLKYQWINHYGTFYNLWLWVKVACNSLKHLCFKGLKLPPSILVKVMRNRVSNFMVGHCHNHTSHRLEGFISLETDDADGWRLIGSKYLSLNCVVFG